MNAVVKTGGKQYLVSVGSKIYVEKMDVAEGDKVVFEEVLMLDGNVGNPYVANALVEGKVVKHGKQKKITIFKYKPKSNKSNRRKQGHRQPYTLIEITSVK